MPRDSLKTYGTVTFDLAVMLDMIKYGVVDRREDGTHFVNEDLGQGDICVTLWLSVVPPAYRPQLVELANGVLKQFWGKQAEKVLLERFVRTLHDRIWREVTYKEPLPEPGPPQRISDKVLVVNLQGCILPWVEEGAMVLGMPGTDDLFVPVFSTADRLERFLAETGLRCDKAVVITDQADFIASVVLDARIALDPHKAANGKTRFTEIIPRPVPGKQ